MKKIFIFLLLLAVVAGGGYYWWQQNSHRIITQQIRKIAGRFFTNPEKLTIEHSTVKMLGLRKARVARLVISGNDLVLRDGPSLAYAKLTLSNVEVSGPPFHLTRVGNGAYDARVTDMAVTQFLHKRGVSVASKKIVPLDSLTVKFLDSAKASARLEGKALIPVINKQMPFSVTGEIVPSSSESGQIDFRPGGVSIKQLRDSLRIVNPLINLSGWPINVDITSIKTVAGAATIRGTVTGANDSLLPQF